MAGFWYKVETMPSGSAVDTSWLNTQGTSKWQLVQVVPMSNISENGRGSVLCYFISGSNT
jgi:hypothetical protein